MVAAAQRVRTSGVRQNTQMISVFAVRRLQEPDQLFTMIHFFFFPEDSVSYTSLASIIE
jgi:hypothetical protein